MSLVRVNELRQERANLVAQARELSERAHTEKRDMTADENTQYDRIMADVTAKKASIDREEKLLDEERALAGSGERVETGVRNPQDTDVRNTKEYREAFARYIIGGKDGVSSEEFRALSAGTASAGGYTVPPTEFVAQLIKDIDNAVVLRSKATVFTLKKAAQLMFPKQTTRIADADWTTEILTGNEDSTLAFGQLILDTAPLAKRIKISETLIHESALPIEDIVRKELAYIFGITFEKALMTADGTNNKPVGIFDTSHADKIPTTRDATATATTAIDADVLRTAKYMLKQEYRGRAEWLFHRDSVARISKLKDGENQYLWQPGITKGDPDTLLQLAINESEYAPGSTLAAATYFGALAVWSEYYIVDVLPFQIKKLNELYAETNQVGFIGRYESSGKPAKAEAFVRLITAAS